MPVDAGGRGPRRHPGADHVDHGGDEAATPGGGRHDRLVEAHHRRRSHLGRGPHASNPDALDGQPTPSTMTVRSCPTAIEAGVPSMAATRSVVHSLARVVSTRLGSASAACSAQVFTSQSGSGARRDDQVRFRQTIGRRGERVLRARSGGVDGVDSRWFRHAGGVPPLPWPRCRASPVFRRTRGDGFDGDGDKSWATTRCRPVRSGRIASDYRHAGCLGAPMGQGCLNRIHACVLRVLSNSFPSCRTR